MLSPRTPPLLFSPFPNMISINYRHCYHILFLLITSLVFSSFFTPCFLVRAQHFDVDNDNSNSNSNSKLKPIYMGVLAIGAVLFLTILYYIARVCDDCSGRLGSDSAPGGLNPDILSEFPVYTYPNVADRIGSKMGPLECAVCLSPYKEEQFLRLIPRCDHLFHRHCVDRWLAAHTTCPVCRADLVAALSSSSCGHSQSSRVESMCIEELENGLAAGLIHQIQNDDTMEGRPETPGWQFRVIWRSNSTGHVADNHRAEEDVERFRLTS